MPPRSSSDRISTPSAATSKLPLSRGDCRLHDSSAGSFTQGVSRPRRLFWQNEPNAGDFSKRANELVIRGVSLVWTTDLHAKFSQGSPPPLWQNEPNAGDFSKGDSDLLVTRGSMETVLVITGGAAPSPATPARRSPAPGRCRSHSMISQKATPRARPCSPLRPPRPSAFPPPRLRRQTVW